MCKVRLGPKGLPNQERELDLIVSAQTAVGGFDSELFTQPRETHTLTGCQDQGEEEVRKALGCKI